MSPRLTPPRLLLLALAAGCAVPAGAQGPLRDIDARRDGRVSFRFAARPDVCGQGSSLLRIGGGALFESGSMTYSSGGGWNAACERGPIRVLITRAEGATVGVRTAVGEGELPADVSDLGAVSSAAAATYFLDLAQRLDGRVGREALSAAVLADSADTWRGLLRLAGNASLSGGLREAAVGWLAREARAAEAADRREIVAALERTTQDRNQTLGLRRRAVSALARAGEGGLDALLALARSGETPVAGSAVDALASSGDPRAREFLREAARDTRQSEAVRVQAIKGLGGRDATPSDYALLRQLYPALTHGTARQAVITELGQAGGSDNSRWLLTLARDGSASREDRSRAVRSAVQAGAGSADLIQLFDTADERNLKTTLIDQMMRLGDRAAIDKVTSIARSDPDPSVRKSAVSRLARSSDPEVAQALRAMIEP